MPHHFTFAVLLLATTFGGQSAAALSEEDLLAPVLAAAAEADVILLGEIHDNPTHHTRQAALLTAIDPAAVVFEMLSSEEAARITPDLAADLDALEAALDWANSGWPDFEYYAPLFVAAADGAILGAEIDRAEAQRAFGEGAAAVFGDAGRRFGLDRPLPEAEQTTREAEQMAAHCDALPPEILPGFVEAQRLRDAALADAVMNALTGPGGPVVVITGNGHARADWGVPALLAQADPDLRVVTLGQVEGEVDPEAPFDFVLAAPPAERDDPCAAFR